MAEYSYELGDKVQLKSGGPVMTVMKMADGKATVTWFEGKKKRTDSFDCTMLVKYQPGAIGFVF